MTKNIFYSYIFAKKQKLVIYNVIFKFNNIIITDKINLIFEIKTKNCFFKKKMLFNYTLQLIITIQFNKKIRK